MSEKKQAKTGSRQAETTKANLGKLKITGLIVSFNTLMNSLVPNCKFCEGAIVP